MHELFFATSHGKSPCDGTGGTVKRLVRRGSLHRPIDNQIINDQMFFNFCTDNIPGIIFRFLSSRMINQSQQNLLPRHAQGRTIPGTHSYHFYHPISANQIGCKYICSDLNFSATFDFSPAKYKKVKSMDFVACWYNFHGWVGLVLSVNEPQLEVDVKFMYPHGPSPSFFGLSKMTLLLFLITKIFAQWHSFYFIQQTNLQTFSTKSENNSTIC